MYWREPNCHECNNDVEHIDDVLFLSEEKGNNILKKWSDIFIQNILEGIQFDINNKEKDLSDNQVSLQLKQEAITEIAKYFENIYIDGLNSIKKEKYDEKWLQDWCIRKSIITVRKMEVDLLFKIVTLLYDEESK